MPRKNRRADYLRHRERNLAYQRLKDFGISDDEFKRLLKLQNYVCFICHKINGSKGRNLCVDHNHLTGKIRGLLCNRCNSAVGVYDTFGSRFDLYLKGGIK